MLDLAAPELPLHAARTTHQVFFLGDNGHTDCDRSTSNAVRNITMRLTFPSLEITAQCQVPCGHSKQRPKYVRISSLTQILGCDEISSSGHLAVASILVCAHVTLALIRHKPLYTRT